MRSGGSAFVTGWADPSTGWPVALLIRSKSLSLCKTIGRPRHVRPYTPRHMRSYPGHRAARQLANGERTLFATGQYSHPKLITMSEKIPLQDIRRSASLSVRPRPSTRGQLFFSSSASITMMPLGPRT